MPTPSTPKAASGPVCGRLIPILIGAPAASGALASAGHLLESTSKAPEPVLPAAVVFDEVLFELPQAAAMRTMPRRTAALVALGVRDVMRVLPGWWVLRRLL